MAYFHKELQKGKWNKLSLIEQMANIGSEVSRTINWKNKSKKDAQKYFLQFNLAARVNT